VKKAKAIFKWILVFLSWGFTIWPVLAFMMACENKTVLISIALGAVSYFTLKLVKRVILYFIMVMSLYYIIALYTFGAAVHKMIHS
jgi:hypothetical protein